MNPFLATLLQSCQIMDLWTISNTQMVFCFTPIIVFKTSGYNGQCDGLWLQRNRYLRIMLINIFVLYLDRFFKKQVVQCLFVSDFNFAQLITMRYLLRQPCQRHFFVIFKKRKLICCCWNTLSSKKRQVGSQTKLTTHHISQT